MEHKIIKEVKSEVKSKVVDTTILNYQSVVEICGCLYRYRGKYERSWAFEYRFTPLTGQGKKADIRISRNKLAQCWLIHDINHNSHVLSNALQLSLFY